jgi:hypothetical protein
VVGLRPQTGVERWQVRGCRLPRVPPVLGADALLRRWGRRGRTRVPRGEPVKDDDKNGDGWLGADSGGIGAALNLDWRRMDDWKSDWDRIWRCSRVAKTAPSRSARREDVTEYVAGSHPRPLPYVPSPLYDGHLSGEGWHGIVLRRQDRRPSTCRSDCRTRGLRTAGGDRRHLFRFAQVS